MLRRSREPDQTEDPASTGSKRQKELNESQPPELTHDDFIVGWVCALPKEQAAAKAMLDDIYPALPKPQDDPNTYILGAIGKHKIVIACLPMGKIGNNAAAICVTQMVRTFPSTKVGLMVGIGGGIPPKVRLGDVVVSTPTGQYPGVVQWDMGKAEKNGDFKRTGALNNPPTALLTALATVQTDHEMAESKIPQYLEELGQKWPRMVPKYLRSKSLKDPMSTPDTSDQGPDDIRIHYGLIASGDQVIKDAEFRDRLNKRLDGEVLCVEMEAAGLMDFPCIVIRGICDYADSNKNKDWQEHAAAVAAAFAKELLQYVQPIEVAKERPIMDLLNQVRKDASETKADVAHIKSGLTRQEDRDILNWLTAVDYGPQQSDYLSRRQDGTGQWLLESKEFKSWVATRKGTLFCPGIPGAGKTILTSVVIDHLGSNFRNNSETAIAYIYCNYKRHNEQNIDHLLISLLKQLVSAQPIMPESVKNIHNEHRIKATRPTLTEIQQLLQSMVAMYSSAFIIVDALDECQETNNCREMLISQLFVLQEKHGINIFATSRYIPEITCHFEKGLSLEIRASSDDVSRYLKHQIRTLPRVVQKDQQLQREIAMGISKVVDGMFLLAKFCVDLFADKFTRKDVQKALNTLQNQAQISGENRERQFIDNAYDQVIERINEQLAGKKKLALKVLSWITYAKRQLTTLELQHALAIKFGTAKLDSGYLPHIEDMVSVCAGLVTVDQESGIVRLVHYTTQDYLGRGKWLPNAESNITRLCVTYLSFKVFDTGYCENDKRFEERLQSNPFYDYAARNWGHHARSNEKISQEVIGFLGSKTKVEASSQGLMSTKVYAGQSGYSQKGPGNMTGLHLAAYFGVSTVIDALLQEQAADLGSGSIPTPLQYSAQNGHKLVVKILLAAGADVNAATSKYRRQTALQSAAEGGHQEVVKILLAAGADVNAATCEFPQKTAIQAAAEGGYQEVVKMLLAAGADVNTADAIYGLTALQAAAEGGHQEVINILLAAGADVNATARDLEGLTALQAAAKGGHREVVKILLAAGANVNATAGAVNGLTALQAAAKGNHQEVVNILLAAGANVNATTHNLDGLTALQAAAKGGHREVVKILLAAGANVNATACPRNGLIALQSAAEGGHQEVVNILLAAGANVNAASEYRGTALQAAAKGGHQEVVKILLAAGADVNAASRYRGTALQAAAEGGYQEVINILLAAGADINAAARAINGFTALQAAAKGGHQEVVNILLAAGADVNATASAVNGFTALQAAAKGNHQEVVNILLAAGANVNAIACAMDGLIELQAAAERCYQEAINILLATSADINVTARAISGLTALQAAAKGGHQEVVKILLAAGADVNAATGNPGSIALQAAAEGGHQEVVKILLAAGADVNAATGNPGLIALQAAAKGGHQKLVNILLTAVADVNATASKFKGQTALQAAAKGGHQEVVNILLAAGADKNGATEYVAL